MFESYIFQLNHSLMCLGSITLQILSGTSMKPTIPRHTFGTGSIDFFHYTGPLSEEGTIVTEARVLCFTSSLFFPHSIEYFTSMTRRRIILILIFTRQSCQRTPGEQKRCASNPVFCQLSFFVLIIFDDQDQDQRELLVISNAGISVKRYSALSEMFFKLDALVPNDHHPDSIIIILSPCSNGGYFWKFHTFPNPITSYPSPKSVY